MSCKKCHIQGENELSDIHMNMTNESIKLKDKI